MGEQVVITARAFLASLVIAVLASIVLSAMVSSTLSFGPKGDPGPQGPRGFGTPNYDSGWLTINAGQTITLTHNLGTTNVYVYLTGKDASGFLHQYDYGNSLLGAAWHNMDISAIQITRASSDQNWTQVRVTIWLIG